MSDKPKKRIVVLRMIGGGLKIRSERSKTGSAPSRIRNGWTKMRADELKTSGVESKMHFGTRKMRAIVSLMLPLRDEIFAA